MHLNPAADRYSPREIARGAGVSERDAIEAIGRRDLWLPYEAAVQWTRRLAARTPGESRLFAGVSSNDTPGPARGIPLAVSGTLHAAVALLAAVLTVGLSAGAGGVAAPARTPDPLRLVFLTAPGPGGGGGGGGREEHRTPPAAKRAGRHPVRSPLPPRKPPEPKRTAGRLEARPAPIDAEPLPPVVAPVVAVPADQRDQIGVVERTSAQAGSHGAGTGGGVGAGTGTGLGEGEGPGLGAGSGGGTGGGPYRPGSGIAPPRLLREVKADYTESARRRGVTGEVLLEIVVRQDGTVGDVRVQQGLDPGLDARAVQAVRQWRFAPAERFGTPVDVIVQVSVEFAFR